MKIRISLIILGLGSSLLLSSCNTGVGLGRDFQRFGQGIENSAYGKQW